MTELYVTVSRDACRNVVPGDIVRLSQLGVSDRNLECVELTDEHATFIGRGGRVAPEEASIEPTLEKLDELIKLGQEQVDQLRKLQRSPV